MAEWAGFKSLIGAVLLGLLVVSPMAAQQAPTAAEEALFQTAQKSGAVADYQAYLAEYPQGAFAEIALFELEWAVKVAPAPGATPETSIAPPETPETAVFAQTGIGFETALIAPGTSVDGKSIVQLIEGSPLFAPIEGLPEALWKDQSCSSCHSWTKEALCTQGQTYSGPNGPHALVKMHPYGGAFKAALKTFALEGCK